MEYSHIILPHHEDIVFVGDVGGAMGLCIGASVVTIFEFFDVIIHTMCKRRLKKSWTKDYCPKKQQW